MNSGILATSYSHKYTQLSCWGLAGLPSAVVHGGAFGFAHLKICNVEYLKFVCKS